MSLGTDGYIAVEELTKTLGLHPNALRKRIAGSGIAVYSDPYDRRRRLILAKDAERLTQPLLVNSENKGGNAADRSRVPSRRTA